MGARALIDINLIWFGYMLAYPSGEKGGVSFIQMISCLRSAGQYHVVQGYSLPNSIYIKPDTFYMGQVRHNLPSILSVRV
jgi:hypothetical protein